ncbi:MAG TPA: hypothetical protein VIH50_02500 [Steroidobacteraceae bacterium]
MIETWIELSVDDLYIEKTILTMERSRNAIAGRAIRSDLTRTGANDARARYAHKTVMMKASLTSGTPVIPGIHSPALPTSMTRKMAAHMLYADDGRLIFFGARTLMLRASAPVVVSGAGSTVNVRT